MSWISSLFDGNKASQSANNTLAGVASFGTGEGESLTSNAGNFFKTLLSGDQGAINKLLAPQINAIQKQTQQKVQANSQFGNRSGGTNASNQAAGDTARSTVNDLVAKLQSGAANSEASLGEGLLNTGAGAAVSQGDLALRKQQMVNQLMEQLGQGLGAAVGGL